MIKPKVLFLCSDNSCRTQMAEAFLRDIGGERFEAISAGAEASRLDPDAVTAMQEAGIDISGYPTRKVDLFLREREIERTCPIFPGAIWRLKWPLSDPATAQSSKERAAMTRRVRDEIREHVVQFVKDHA